MRFLADPDRDVTYPVGLLLWSADGSYFQGRLPKPEQERIDHVRLDEVLPYLRLALGQLTAWSQQGRLPLSKETPRPLSDSWWTEVSKLLRHSVRIEAVHPVQVENPDDEIDSLYEAIVKPELTRKANRSRVDGAVTRALDTLASRFRRGAVPAYGGMEVPGLRRATGRNRIVVVEAVNLASQGAVNDADAMLGRLSRVKDAGQEVHFVLGYLSSPGGLNGERPVKEYIEYKLETPMFDLTREPQAFHERAAAELGQLEPSEEIEQSFGVHATTG